MSVLFRGSFGDGCACDCEHRACCCSNDEDGTAVVVTSKGESKMMKHKHKTVPAGYTAVTGHTAIIMMDGKMYMKSGLLDREHDLDFTPGGN